MGRHVSGLERARLALEQRRRFPAGALPQVIAESWQRCVDHGLDPTSQPEGAVVDTAGLRERRQKSDLVRRLALAEMQLLYSQIAGSNFMIAFGDRDGVVLDTISDSHFASSAAGKAIIPGSIWSEDIRGTNAVGLAAVTNQPVAVHGGEHFFACHGGVTCMASPILDSHGEIVGLLDASSSCEARQQHTLALVHMATAHIENSLIFSEQSGLLVLAFHPRVEYLATLSAGVLAVSSGGVVRSLNRRAINLLSGLEPRVGDYFEDLFEASFAGAMDSLLKGGITRVRDRAGSGVFMVCRQLGEFGGLSLSFGPPSHAIGTPAAAANFIYTDHRALEQMQNVASAVTVGMPVHIIGETGTGKELIARYAHDCSGREGEFVALNCGALPETLFIAEIFGYEKGAFTNAHPAGAPGLIRQADKGTLFLDEVGEIPPGAQSALLRFLDDFEVRPIGGHKSYKVDVQVISATNRNLEAAVKEGRFRADLLYRLNSLEVRLPPLRERTDFLQCVRFLLDRIAPGLAITDAAVQVLRRHDWPGNFRELRSLLQRLALRSKGQPIDDQAVQVLLAPRSAACPDCVSNPLKRAQCEGIACTYERTGGNISEAARLLGTSRTTLYKHLRHRMSVVGSRTGAVPRPSWRRTGRGIV